MKQIFSFIALLLIVSCKSEPKLETITITSDEVKTAVTYLASDELNGRRAGSEGIEKAASYIESEFKSYGVKPYYETYRDHFKIDSLDAFNVIGFIEGTDAKLKDEVIILGAHYDHIGKGKTVDGDSLANGANDNAAGTVGVIAMARYFAKRKNNKRSIMFALFSAEEMGLLGSKHLAKRLKSENLNLYTMLNFEMIGVPFKDRDYEAFVTGYDLSNMADKINEYVGSNLIGASDVAKKYQLFKRSDNYPFYEEFGLPCQTISSCDLSNFDYYHHVDDEISQLDFDFMASLINKTIPAIEEMSNTETKDIKMYATEAQ
ncbi:M28 family metallopeptidase [Psychroserpens algicola]|uniref:M20/M25/M40 family metallo-hydrolase n=1 Tax=Psychroserpens algicola TaxID=1719034 RepID=A0ABT0H5M9_9FLAO|nr:M20/M25/M40 family metallo-hydrolase [Psychroserpens algicola]MCK8479673.1 M20/M25/M40 family metallo-hydrolase [Psychroserpens algicola]